MTPRLTGFTLCALAMVTAGSTVIASKLIASGIPPFTATALRFAIAFPVLALLMHLTKTGWPRPDKHDQLLLLAQSASGSVGYTVLLIAGTGLTAAVAAGTITGTLPAVAAAIAVIILGEHLNRNLIGSAVLAAFGVLLVSIPASGEGMSPMPGALLGNVLVFGAVICEAAFILLNKKLRTPIPPLPLSTLMTGIGLALTLVPALMERPWTLLLEPLPLLGVFYYALIPTVVGFLLWYAGSQRISGAEASIMTALAPVTAITLAAILLNETIRANHVLGAVSVITALSLTLIPQPAPRKPAQTNPGKTHRTL